MHSYMLPKLCIISSPSVVRLLSIQINEYPNKYDTPQITNGYNRSSTLAKQEMNAADEGDRESGDETEEHKNVTIVVVNAEAE